MNKKTLSLVMLVVLLIIGGLIFLSLPKRMDNGETNNPDNNPPLVGGDKDEHGCIGSAGYRWCEYKQKCLRIWEEECYPSAEVAVQNILATKYSKSLEDVRITIRQQTETHTVGGVKFAPFDSQNTGGLFLATKLTGDWEVVYDGNGSVNCEELKGEYEFPKELLASICD